MAEPSTANPYPGPRPFVAGEKLYGRNHEVTKLFYLLSAERIVVLHSPSGAGKSSLLNAGLVPRLRAERFDVWPTIRLSQPAADGGNRFVGSAVSSLEEGLPESRRRPTGEIAGETLAEYVARRPRRPGAPPSVVLVFDQFEEVLTLDPLGVEARREFFGQLGDALANPEVWALFALREDYLGALEPYRDDVPTRLGNTFRLDLLTVDGAKDAIAGPARDAGREFAPDAAEKLAKDLATVSVQRPDGGFEEKTGLYVEPLQLQVVCRRLWDELPAGTRTIGVDNLLAAGDVDVALAAYYDGCVEDVAHADGASERGLREWFGERLITAGGIRGQVLREQSASGDLDNDSVDRLVATHLVRAEQRDGKTWFELAHDRLVAPVRESNTSWFEQHLHPMQRQAALWDREGRPDSLLLRGRELEDAETWARENASSVRPVEKDLLALSIEQRQDERRRRRTLIAIGVGLLALVALFAALGAWALVQRTDARHATASATSLALTSAANEALAAHPDVALLLSLDANRVHSSVQSRSTALSALEAVRRSGAEAILHGHTGPVETVAFSPDGRILASAGDDKTIRLWDVATRTQLGQPLHDNTGAISTVAFSPDGRTLASGSADGTIRLWNVAGHAQIGKPLDAHIHDVTSLAFSPNGRTLAAAGTDGALELLDVAGRTKTGRRLPFPDSSQIVSVAFSPDGRTLVSASLDNTIRLWNVTTRQPTGIGLDIPAFTVAFRSDGRRLAVGGDDGRIRLVDVSTHRLLGRPFPAHTDAVWGVAFAPNGHTLVSAGDDGTVRLWNLATHKELGRPLPVHGGVQSVAFSHDGHTIAAAGGDGTVLLWDAKTQEQLGQALAGEDPTDISGVAFSPDGRTLASAGRTLRFWSVGSHTELGKPVGVRGGALSIAFSPDGRTVATAGTDGMIRLWDVAARKERGQPLHGHTGSVAFTSGSAAAIAFFGHVAWSPDGRTLASAGTDAKIRLWNVADHELRGEPLRVHGRVSSVAFSPDGRTLASADDDTTVRLWSVATHRQIGRPLRGHTDAVSSVAFSPDGHILASGDDDGTIRFWNVDTREQLGQPLLAGDAVSDLAFSPDGHTLASAGGALRLWDVATHQQLGQALGGGGNLERVAFSPDGRGLATASQFVAVQLWSGILWKDVDALRADICGLVRGSLTLDEWQRYASGVPYRTTCPG